MSSTIYRDEILVVKYLRTSAAEKKNEGIAFLAESELVRSIY
jgi:hypothetical protein